MQRSLKQAADLLNLAPSQVIIAAAVLASESLMRPLPSRSMSSTCRRAANTRMENL